jgi:hypothetical protein
MRGGDRSVDFDLSETVKPSVQWIVIHTASDRNRPARGYGRRGSSSRVSTPFCRRASSPRPSSLILSSAISSHLPTASPPPATKRRDSWCWPYPRRAGLRCPRWRGIAPRERTRVATGGARGGVPPVAPSGRGVMTSAVGRPAGARRSACPRTVDGGRSPRRKSPGRARRRRDRPPWRARAVATSGRPRAADRATSRR